jgi:hypothetical protein
MNTTHYSLRILAPILALIAGEFCYASGFQKQVSSITPVEIFQVYELPITVTGAELVRSGRAFELRCSITNNSNEKLLGFRYSLVAIDSDDGKHAVVSRSEAFSLPAYETKNRTIRTPLNIKLKVQHRVVLMFEQIVGTDSIWEVIKPKDALEAYLSGDYSVIPRVLRVANQVDVPLRLRIPY